MRSPTRSAELPTAFSVLPGALMTVPSFLFHVLAVTLDPHVLIVYLLLGFFARRLVWAIAGAVVWDVAFEGWIYLQNPGGSHSRFVPGLVGAFVASAAVFGVRRAASAVWRRL
jgi:hypothetical protein